MNSAHEPANHVPIESTSHTQGLAAGGISGLEGPATSGAGEFEEPSRARYIVLGLMCALAFVLYIDRICVSQAATDIMKELNITKASFGYVLAAFTVAYGLFEVPIGWWGDRYGSRGVLSRIVIGWSIFTALTGAAWNFTSLVIVRFLFGAGEAGAFPNTARVLSRWFPIESRGTAQGLINSISLIGGAIAPVMTQALMDGIGWRWTFVFFCTPGLVWAAVFYWWYRDDPQTHPAVNAAERRLIAAGTDSHHRASHPPIPWKLVLVTPQIWLLGFVIACSSFNSYFYFSWYPTYLKEGRGLAPDDAARMASLVLFGGAIGSISGGLLIDFLMRLTQNRHLCRRCYSALALTLSAGCLIAGRYSDSSLIASLWTAGSVLFVMSTLASWWGSVTDVSGRHLGALFGLMNSMGTVGAVGSQLFVGVYADRMKSYGYTGRAQWDSMFFIYASALILGACGWSMINSGKGVEPRS